MAVDPLTIALFGGMGLDFLGNFFSSKENSEAAKANLAYQLQRQNLIGGHVNQMMQPGMNPFAQAMLRFTGQQLPGTSMYNFNPQIPSMVNQRIGTMDTNNPPPTGQGSGGETGNPGGSGDPGVLYNMIPGGGTGGFNLEASQQQYAPQSNFYNPGYNFNAALSDERNWTTAHRDAQNNTDWMWDIPGRGISTGNPGGFGNSPEQIQAAYNNYLLQAGIQPGSTRPGGFANPLDYPGIDLSGGGGPPIDRVPTGQGLPGTDVAGPWQGPPMPPDVNYPADGGAAGGAGGAGGMFRYQNPGAFTYNPMMLGQAPQISGLPQLQGQNIFAPQASAFGASTPQATAFNAFAPQVGTPGLTTPERVGATGTQALNAGQDALMQMMRKNLQPSRDPNMDLQLQQLGQGDSSYGMSDLFKSLDDQAKMGLDDQIAQLRGSAGSLGERFGSAMTNAEGRLRSRALTDLNAQKQALGFQGFEAAQGRRLPALGLGADLLNQGNQFNLQGFGLQSGIARDLAGLGQQGSALDLQAQLANQGAGIQTGLANQGLLAQLGMFNAGQGLQANQFNAGQNTQNSQFNANLASQLGMFNAGQGTQNSQFNAGLGMQGALANQANNLAAQQGNQNAWLQAALANQGLAGQYGLANQGAFNQAGQFNAGQRTVNDQFAAQQGNIFNNFMMQALSQGAGLQANQNSYNASLLGILAGVPTPQTQPTTWGASMQDAGSMLMMPWLYSQFMK